MTDLNKLPKTSPLRNLSSTAATALQNLGNTDSLVNSFKLPDNRTRAERREDFENSINGIDKQSIGNLKEEISKLSERTETAPQELWHKKDEIENTLIKFIRLYNKFEQLNSEDSRRVELKKKELKLESSHDWAEKSRLFFFRVLASLLFIGTLFAIGYIEHNYDWARLPLAKYIKPVPNVPSM